MNAASSASSSTTDFSNVAMSFMAQALAGQMASLLKVEFAKLNGPIVQPMLFDVKQAATDMGRSEQAIQHMIFERRLPVLRDGRRVHLHRPDLDAWIERNKE